MKINNFKKFAVLAALATSTILAGCVVYPGRTVVDVDAGGPYTCTAYGVGGRHWTITGPNRANVRGRVIAACQNNGGVGCYIPRRACTPR